MVIMEIFDLLSKYIKWEFNLTDFLLINEYYSLLNKKKWYKKDYGEK